MDGKEVDGDCLIARLVEMGFDYSSAVEAVKAVGCSLNDATDYLLNASCKNSSCASTSSKCSKVDRKATERRMLPHSQSLGKMRQSSILGHISRSQTKRSRHNEVNVLGTGAKVFPGLLEGKKCPLSGMSYEAKITLECGPDDCPDDLDCGAGWEQKVQNLLLKHFRYASLKAFQREALAAWLSHQDCLVLAATGSGKSLCFQIPALLTGKVVVVISPLISLMHDQCMKLAKHGISACFLGSGQPDNSVEKKALKGMYDIIYVCPETVLRLIKPLQSLAEGRGIALFAIDEVHCVSKWGHDFRPDYRRLSVIRENFSTCSLKFLKRNIPLMALTATATSRVREDVIQCLYMSKETKIILTSFYRSNLRFSVKHSRTSSAASYKIDFHDLIKEYSMRRKINGHQRVDCAEKFEMPKYLADDYYDRGDVDSDDGDDADSAINGSDSLRDREMTVEYLEDESDIFHGVDDWDVHCGEFYGESLDDSREICNSVETIDLQLEPEQRLKLQQKPLEHGPTIIYVPTRKETLSIAKFFGNFGIRAAAYNAKLPKLYLRQVHKDFHEDKLEVVIATMAFGMGIDKLNVRRIVHYGWPQSLEAYYQEAGRAGRDGKLADCILYANLARVPTLLPSRRSEDQSRLAYKMLTDCHRYGMNTTNCRARMLVEYFGEHFSQEKCLSCDVCIEGPPEMLDVKEEADIFMQFLAAHKKQCEAYNGTGGNDNNFVGDTYATSSNISSRERVMKLNLRVVVTKIREQCHKYMAIDMLWWRGFARVMEVKGYIKEGDDKTHVQIKYPELTKRGLDFVELERGESLPIFPEADMLLAARKCKPFATFSDWGKGWADPEIRHQRLERMRTSRTPRRRKSRKSKQDPKTVRGRLADLLRLKSR